MDRPQPPQPTAAPSGATATPPDVLGPDDLLIAPASLPDGRPAAVVAVARQVPGPLRCTREAVDAVRAAAPDAEVVVWIPAGTPPDPVLGAAGRCDASRPVLATAAPVTDAVKRVEGDLVVAAVDREALRWPVAPAVTHRSRLGAADRALPGAPVAVLAGRVDWL